MIQSIKCLPQTCGDLSSIPGSHVKAMVMCACKTCHWEGRHRSMRTHTCMYIYNHTHPLSTHNTQRRSGTNREVKMELLFLTLVVLARSGRGRQALHFFLWTHPWKWFLSLFGAFPRWHNPVTMSPVLLVQLLLTSLYRWEKTIPPALQKVSGQTKNHLRIYFSKRGDYI